MKLETQIVPWWYDSSKCSAALVIDGVVTTFECSHLHKSERTAEKCLPEVLASAQRMLDDPTFEEVQLSEDLFEWRTHQVDGRFNSTRFRRKGIDFQG